MGCYRKLIGIPNGKKTRNGKNEYNFIRYPGPDAKELWPDSVVVPCGKCLGCRLDYSRSWADRMMLELETSDCGIFLTLTYNNENITWCHFDEEGFPDQGTLVVRDVQLFLKRLRKYFCGKRIRFYCAGEYGSFEKTCRPHYHMIIFGLSINDFEDKTLVGKTELGFDLYKSDIVERIWQNKGFCAFSDVSWKTCAYVARYVTKKVHGDINMLYEALGKAPEFSIMSRKPGIGAEYLSLHPDCLDYQNINLSTPEGGLKIQIPRYYLKKLELQNPERYDIIKEQRKEFSTDRELLELAKTDLEYIDYMEMKENEQLKKTKSLKRNVV